MSQLVIFGDQKTNFLQILIICTIKTTTDCLFVIIQLEIQNKFFIPI